eukprot:Hpha_TRINITY_DN6513_c0_g1::TRINITY_DN6513_c0_g1_i1::g.45888::m.45888
MRRSARVRSASTGSCSSGGDDDDGGGAVRRELRTAARGLQEVVSVLCGGFAGPRGPPDRTGCINISDTVSRLQSAEQCGTFMRMNEVCRSTADTGECTRYIAALQACREGTHTTHERVRLAQGKADEELVTAFQNMHAAVDMVRRERQCSGRGRSLTVLRAEVQKNAAAAAAARAELCEWEGRCRQAEAECNAALEDASVAERRAEELEVERGEVVREDAQRRDEVRQLI